MTSVRGRQHPSWLVLLLVATGSGAGCIGDPGRPEDSEDLVSVSSAEFFGTGNPFGTETAVTSSISNGGLGEFVMTSNANSDSPFLTYNNNSRQIRPSTSLMTFKVLAPDDEGGNILASGRIRPPGNWTVLWGDPAIVRNKANSSFIYLANLAVPSSKFPSGVIEGAINPTTGIPANFCGAFIGGACIARSSNAGRTFTLATSDCLQRITGSCPFGSFYDGSALETSPEGRVYAAFTDVFRARYDVYMATSLTGGFSLVTDPPTSSVFAHPRIKMGSNGLYMLTWDGFNLNILRYPAGSSFTAAWTSPVNVATSAESIGTITLSDRSIRTGPQYDLAIGKNENNVEEIRVIFEVVVSGKHKLRVAKCTLGTPITCSQPSVWRTDGVAGDQWGPSITTGNTFSTGAPFWMFTYYNNQNFSTGNQVEIWTGLLPSSFTASFTRRENLAQVPCPDLRGYWGDYDYMLTGNTGSGPPGLTFRGFSLSGSSCVRSNFTSNSLSDSYSSLLQ